MQGRTKVVNMKTEIENYTIVILWKKIKLSLKLANKKTR